MLAGYKCVIKLNHVFNHLVNIIYSGYLQKAIVKCNETKGITM